MRGWQSCRPCSEGVYKHAQAGGQAHQASTGGLDGLALAGLVGSVHRHYLQHGRSGQVFCSDLPHDSPLMARQYTH